MLTLGSAALVLYEKHSKNQGKMLKWSLLSEIAVIFAALVSLCGTIGAIRFRDIVSHIKDVDLHAYKTKADLTIADANKTAAQARKDAGKANSQAQEAREKADNVGHDNIRFSANVKENADQARSAESTLERKTKTLLILLVPSHNSEA